MNDLVLDDGGRHIPGSGIDFAVVGRLRLVTDLARVPAREHRALIRGVRRPGPEKLFVSRILADVGDIIVQTKSKSGRLLLGRPMQVRAMDGDTAVLADDPSLGAPIAIDPLFASAFAAPLGSGAVWTVLDAWGVLRCPRCGGPALHDGGNAGPPEAGYYAGSCVVDLLGGSELCARCGAEWTPGGGRSLLRDSLRQTDQALTRVAAIAIERGFDMTLNAELLYDSTSAVLHFGGRAYGSGFLIVSRADSDEVDLLGRPYFDWRVIDGRGETMAFGEEYVDLDGASHPLEMLVRLITDITQRCVDFPDDDDALLPPGDLLHLDGGWWVRHYVAPALAAHLGPVSSVVEELDVV